MVEDISLLLQFSTIYSPPRAGLSYMVKEPSVMQREAAVQMILSSACFDIDKDACNAESSPA
jgi:hypothetical protein